MTLNAGSGRLPAMLSSGIGVPALAADIGAKPRVDYATQRGRRERRTAGGSRAIASPKRDCRHRFDGCLKCEGSAGILVRQCPAEGAKYSLDFTSNRWWRR